MSTNESQTPIYLLLFSFSSSRRNFAQKLDLGTGKHKNTNTSFKIHQQTDGKTIHPNTIYELLWPEFSLPIPSVFIHHSSFNQTIHLSQSICAYLSVYNVRLPRLKASAGGAVYCNRYDGVLTFETLFSIKTYESNDATSYFLLSLCGFCKQQMKPY